MLKITRTNHKGEVYETVSPEVGDVIRFSAQPYHYGTMEVTVVEIVGKAGEPMGQRFKITGCALAGSTTTSRLFGASSSQSCEGQEFTIYCWGPASDGGWDYVYPV